MSDSLDHCPHCRQGLEIIFVKFTAFGARPVSSCPNCALMPIEPRSTPPRTTLPRYFSSGTRMIGAFQLTFQNYRLHGPRCDFNCRFLAPCPSRLWRHLARGYSSGLLATDLCVRDSDRVVQGASATSDVGRRKRGNLLKADGGMAALRRRRRAHPESSRSQGNQGKNKFAHCGLR